MKENMVTVEATISKVVENQSYAVCYPRIDLKMANSELITQSTSITFSLENWSDDLKPKKGQVVLLQNIRKFKGGWRARNARPVRI